MDLSADEAKLIVTALYTVTAAMIALTGSILGSVLTFWASVRNNRKNLFVNTVTTERAKWRQDLRTVTADIVEAAGMALAQPTPEHLGKFEAHRVAIRLRLNPSREAAHKLDQDILAALKNLAKFVSDGDKPGANSELEVVEDRVQKLLKAEWDKSKREARKGAMQVK